MTLAFEFIGNPTEATLSFKESCATCTTMITDTLSKKFQTIQDMSDTMYQENIKHLHSFPLAYPLLLSHLENAIICLTKEHLLPYVPSYRTDIQQKASDYTKHFQFISEAPKIETKAHGYTSQKEISTLQTRFIDLATTLAQKQKEESMFDTDDEKRWYYNTKRMQIECGIVPLIQLTIKALSDIICHVK